MNKLLRRISEEMQAGRDCALVTIVAADGSTPGKAGAKMLVGRSGRLTGTIGGGALELRGILEAQRRMEARQGGVMTCELTREGSRALGMACGGRVELLFSCIFAGDAAWRALCLEGLARAERRENGWLLLPADGRAPGLYTPGSRPEGFPPPEAPSALKGRAPVRLSETLYAVPLAAEERLIIFGAGHVAQALAPLADAVGFCVAVYDDRPDFANPVLFPRAQSVICGDYGRFSRHFTVTGEDYVVIMTNGHANDLVVQERIMGGEYAYLGVIGSRRKTAALNEQLLERGISPQALEGVHTPIGLDIGAVTPEEIAVSIAAELIMVRARRRADGGTRPCPMG